MDDSLQGGGHTVLSYIAVTQHIGGRVFPSGGKGTIFVYAQLRMDGVQLRMVYAKLHMRYHRVLSTVFGHAPLHIQDAQLRMVYAQLRIEYAQLRIGRFPLFAELTSDDLHPTPMECHHYSAGSQASLATDGRPWAAPES